MGVANIAFSRNTKIVLAGAALWIFWTVATEAASPEDRQTRNDFSALCSFYQAAVPVEVFETVDMPSCPTGVWSASLETLNKEAALLWSAIASLGKERADGLRARYEVFRLGMPQVLTAQSARTMKVEDLCDKYAGNADDRVVVIQELKRRKTFTKEWLSLVENGRIHLGMPETAVYCALGRPTSTNRSVGAWGVHKQLVYGTSYVYIQNGKVTSWQD